MKSIMSRARIAALLLLVLALMSCGNATEYGGPPGVSGALTINPQSVSLNLTSSNSCWTYPGGDIKYFVVVGGTPPYYWYQSTPAVAILDPLDEGDDGVYRRAKYTTKSFSGCGDATVTDTISVVDQAGGLESATFTISVTVETAS